MELLCIFAALAVLFLFCAFLTLKCNLHAALAPLTALGIAVAWLTAAGMANLLLPGTVLLWAVFVGSGVWGLVPHKGQRPAYRRLVTVSSLSGGRRLGRGVLQGQHRRGAAPFHPGQRAVLGHGAGICGVLFHPPAAGNQV